MRRVLLLVETASTVGRGIMVGIWRSKRGLGGWSTLAAEPSLERFRRAIQSFDGDGIIARVHSEEMARVLRAKRIPVVDVLGAVPGAGFPVVTVDDAAVGREGARHLKECGHTHFGFVQLSDVEEGWSRERGRAFVAALGRRPVSVLDTTWARTGETRHNPISTWLEGLHRPTGVMACSDRMALLVVAECAALGIEVPEMVSVLGVDDDEMFSAMSEVPLSSVGIDYSRLGYEAALLLERLMRGETPGRGPLLIPPNRVAVRASTDALAIDDRAVATALKFIRQRAHGELHIDDVARRAGVSRTPLQRRFREALGRSVHDEIVRVRLEHAQRLLTETELAIPVVAERSGIHSQAYLCRLFRSKFGTTPARYRRDAQAARTLPGAKRA